MEETLEKEKYKKKKSVDLFAQCHNAKITRKVGVWRKGDGSMYADSFRRKYLFLSAILNFTHRRNINPVFWKKVQILKNEG